MPVMQWHEVYRLILGLCWGLVTLAWVGGAVYNAFKAPAVQKASNPFYSLLLVFIIVVAVWQFVPHTFWTFLTFDTLWLRVIGIVLLLVFTAFTLWARQVLGTMWSLSAVKKEGHILRTNGPYRITRHPIYTGILGMLAGSMLMSGFGLWLFAFLIGIVVFAAKILSEERLLLDAFGEEYVQYKQRVPQLIPGLQWLKAKNTVRGEKSTI